MLTRLPKRFWDKVDRSGGEGACHPWLGSLVNGYGQFSYQGGNHTVHRLVYESVHGSAKGARIGHSCTMDHCCNPGHIGKILRKRPRPGVNRRGRPRLPVVRIYRDSADRLIRLAEGRQITVEALVDEMIDQVGA